MLNTRGVAVSSAITAVVTATETPVVSGTPDAVREVDDGPVS